MLKHLPGSIYRRTHQASVDAILGADAPQVVSAGDEFHNVDRWTVVYFQEEITSFEGERLDYETVGKLVAKVNEMQTACREIRIASTPDDLDPTLSKALTGGAYHEAWHTLYSMRDNLDPQQMWDLLEFRWRPKFWTTKQESLKAWANIVEDIRIERLGCAEFPGTRANLEALQDFILEHEVDPNPSQPGAEYACIFRDLGLGYDTRKQAEVWSKRDPAQVAFVREHLGDLLVEAIQALADDKTACMRIAMDVLLRLPEENSKPNPRTANRQTKLAERLRAIQQQATSAGTMPWRPYTTEHDQVSKVSGQRSATEIGKLAQETRQASSFLLTRLRTLVKNSRQGLWSRGHLKGPLLSEQMLIDTHLSVRSGVTPLRAFDRPGVVRSPSTAISILIDQSGSMRLWLAEAQKVLMTLGTVFDSLEVACEIVGFSAPPQTRQQTPPQFHRDYPVQFNVFKDYNEPMRTVSWRLEYLQPDGHTPTGDAIHYGIESLRHRVEKTRALFVITDGKPFPKRQGQVVQYFLNKSELPIFAIGVTDSARGVETLFGDRGFWVPSFETLPAKILTTMRDILLEKV